MNCSPCHGPSLMRLTACLSKSSLTWVSAEPPLKYCPSFQLQRQNSQWHDCYSVLTLHSLLWAAPSTSQAQHEGLEEGGHVPRATFVQCFSSWVHLLALKLKRKKQFPHQIVPDNSVDVRVSEINLHLAVLKSRGQFEISGSWLTCSW